MQIHEITQHPDALLAEVTLPSEWLGQKVKGAASSVANGLGRTASAIGNTTPFKKAAAVFNNPGAMTSARGYGNAMNTYYKGQVDKTQAGIDAQIAGRLAQQTQQRAKELAQKWIQQVQAKKATTPIKESTLALLPEAIAGAPTPAELAKYQQKVAAAANPKTGFSALPGSTLPAPGKVNPAVTANPKTVMTGNRANEFKSWVDQQLTSTVTGTNQTISMAQVRQDPETLKKLNALLPTIIMKNDPAAIEQYLIIAMTAMQKLSAQIKQQQKTTTSTGSNSSVSKVTPLSAILTTKQIEDIKAMAQDPTKAYAIKQTFGLK